MLLRAFAKMGATVALAFVFSNSAFAEDREVNAYSIWSFFGQVIPSSEVNSKLVGVFRGGVYVEEPDGLGDAGNIACTSTISANEQNGQVDAQGSCAISAAGGQRLYGEYACAGTIGLGCKGSFSIISGTDEFVGVSGSGDFMLRMIGIGGQVGNIVEGAVTGLAIWRNLKISVPEANAAAATTAQ